MQNDADSSRFPNMAHRTLTHNHQELLRRRVASGLTQYELAEKSGVSQARISFLERGLSSTSVKVLKRLAAALPDCAPEDLMTAEFRAFIAPPLPAGATV